LQNNTLQYQYDAVGNLVKLTYPDDKEVHYAYNEADQLIKVTDWASRETIYEYDPNGRLISTLRPNGTQMTRIYDEAGLLKQQKDVVVATGEVISWFDFSYDKAGNIVEEKSSPEADPDINLEMTYQAANRLATHDGDVVQFDADGNMTKGPLGGELVDFTFDSRNRLIQAGSTTYRYDAENQRIGVNQTQFVVNSQPNLSQVLVKEENGVKTFYVYGLGLIGEETGSEYTSYHFDLRGSTVALTNSTGQVTERFQYSPYGMLLSGDVIKTPFLFNGMYGVMTDGNGLYYMRARFYSPEMRRFVNQDILLGFVEDGQTLNRYAYVTGDPISKIDPFGLAEYCGECANEDCVFYEGNLCPTEPNSIDNFANGFYSYFRAYWRLFRDVWRRIGFSSQCEQDFTEMESEALSGLINELWNDPDFQQKVYNQLLEQIKDNKAALAGRVVANIIVTAAILRGKGGRKVALPVGLTLSTGAVMGDVRYYIEVAVKANQEIDTERLMEIIVSGEAGDFVKYYDVSCACRN
jgi:RHS repeat-associated protein